MFHQYDVEIVDDDLAGEKHDCLQSFAERMGTPGERECSRSRPREKVGCDDRNHAGQHRALYAQPKPDQHERSAEPDQSFQHEVNSQ